MINKFAPEEILNFLREESVMSIAVNLDDKPISSIVSFAVDHDFSFYFVTKRNTYKAQALEKNNQISLCVWNHEKLLVQASGTVMEIDDPEDLDDVIKTVLSSLKHLKNFWWPILAIKGGEFVSYKIHTEWLRVLDLSSAEDKLKQRYFEIELKKDSSIREQIESLYLT